MMTAMGNLRNQNRQSVIAFQEEQCVGCSAESLQKVSGKKIWRKTVDPHISRLVVSALITSVLTFMSFHGIMSILPRYASIVS